MENSLSTSRNSEQLPLCCRRSNCSCISAVLENACNWKHSSFQGSCCYFLPRLRCPCRHDYFFGTQADKTSMGRVYRNIYFQHSLLSAKVLTRSVGWRLEYFTVKLCLILQWGTEKRKTTMRWSNNHIQRKAGKCYTAYVSIWHVCCSMWNKMQFRKISWAFTLAW